MQTKHQVTKRFIIGVILIALSLIIGKLVLIPFFFFPSGAHIKSEMAIIWLITWPMLFVGIYFAGMEGYRLATHKYKEYKSKTIHHVKEQLENCLLSTILQIKFIILDQSTL